MLVLKPRDAIMEGDLARESALGEQLERAIDGGDAYLGVALLHETVELFDGEVLAGLDEGAEDGVTLLGVLQADALQMLMEALLSVAQGFARERRVVIDPFLQHAEYSGYQQRGWR
jgi:hypothetical protein